MNIKEYLDCRSKEEKREKHQGKSNARGIRNRYHTDEDETILSWYGQHKALYIDPSVWNILSILATLAIWLKHFLVQENTKILWFAVAVALCLRSNSKSFLTIPFGFKSGFVIV